MSKFCQIWSHSSYANVKCIFYFFDPYKSHQSSGGEEWFQKKYLQHSYCHCDCGQSYKHYTTVIYDDRVFFFKKMDQPRPLFCLFLVFSNKHHYNCYNKYMWKNVHPVYGTGIQNMSLLPGHDFCFKSWSICFQKHPSLYARKEDNWKYVVLMKIYK